MECLTQNLGCVVGFPLAFDLRFRLVNRLVDGESAKRKTDRRDEC